MNEIYYVFQPIVRVCNGEIYGYEALMRTKNKPITEIIEDLKSYEDYYHIEKTTFFNAANSFRERGYKGKLFMNSFPNVCLNDQDMEEFLFINRDIIKDIVIEILESPELSIDALNTKKAIREKSGCMIAMDDFGTGHNHVSTINDICPNIIKIDRSLVSHIYEDRENQEIVKDLLKRCKILGIQTLAEGVETEEEFNYFKDLGVDYIQGYYIAKPM